MTNFSEIELGWYLDGPDSDLPPANQKKSIEAQSNRITPYLNNVKVKECKNSYDLPLDKDIVPCLHRWIQIY